MIPNAVDQFRNFANGLLRFQKIQYTDIEQTQPPKCKVRQALICQNFLLDLRFITCSR